MGGADVYDAIGRGYAGARRADPTIVSKLHESLSTAAGRRLLDVAAGTGNYSGAFSDLGWNVTALEPSAVMRAQRQADTSITWVGGIAERLPFRADAFDGVSCVSALHHLKERGQALSEMARVAGAGPIVLFTRDPRIAEPCWMEHYFPEVWAESHATYPAISDLATLARQSTGKKVEIEQFPLPATLADRFAAAGWNRPELYLEHRVRASMSPFARTTADVVNAGVEKLRHDLASGLWDERYGALRKAASYQAGYYILTAR
jgi:ubiquinone/menaquinone biosynthesis C-methylase UbiE